MSTPIKILLLLLGAIAVSLAARSLYISIGTSPDNKQHISEPTVSIRVAATNLPAGLLLRNEDLDWLEIAKRDVPNGAVLQGSNRATEMSGVMVRRDIRSGTPVLERDIIRPNAPGFLSAVLKPGMRAVSVAIDNVSGNAGLIQPGDYVDMILVQETGGRGNSTFGFPAVEAKARSVVSETVVEKARVIAVGSEFLQFKEDDAERKDPGRNAARTVTLEVRPRAAEAIAVASRLGTITLALRSFALTGRDADDSDVGVTWAGDQDSEGPLWAGDVSQAIAAATARQQAAEKTTENAPPTDWREAPPEPVTTTSPRQITIYRGSEQSTQTLGTVTTQ